VSAQIIVTRQDSGLWKILEIYRSASALHQSFSNRLALNSPYKGELLNANINPGNPQYLEAG
jgi:hypothetical protein